MEQAAGIVNEAANPVWRKLASVSSAGTWKRASSCGRGCGARWCRETATKRSRGGCTHSSDPSRRRFRRDRHFAAIASIHFHCWVLADLVELVGHLRASAAGPAFRVLRTAEVRRAPEFGLLLEAE